MDYITFAFFQKLYFTALSCNRFPEYLKFLLEEFGNEENSSRSSRGKSSKLKGDDSKTNVKTRATKNQTVRKTNKKFKLINC